MMNHYDHNMIIFKNKLETKFIIMNTWLKESKEYLLKIKSKYSLLNENEHPDYDFSMLDFEECLPYNMRCKHYSILEDDTVLYWVTQDEFDEGDLERFACVLGVKTPFKKAYIVLRDYSSYDLNKDIKNRNRNHLRIVHPKKNCYLFQYDDYLAEYLDEVVGQFISYGINKYVNCYYKADGGAIIISFKKPLSKKMLDLVKEILVYDVLNQEDLEYLFVMNS